MAGFVNNVNYGYVAGLEAEIDIEDAEEATQEKAGAYEENAGQGYFDYDQDGTEATAAATFTGAASGVFESFGNVGAGER